MYGGPLEIMQHMYLYDHTWIKSSAQGGDKKNCSVGEDNSNMCKDDVIKMELI
jgi:hypothetical protein